MRQTIDVQTINKILQSWLLCDPQFSDLCVDLTGETPRGLFITDAAVLVKIIDLWKIRELYTCYFEPVIGDNTVETKAHAWIPLLENELPVTCVCSPSVAGLEACLDYFEPTTQEILSFVFYIHLFYDLFGPIFNQIMNHSMTVHNYCTKKT